MIFPEPVTPAALTDLARQFMEVLDRRELLRLLSRCWPGDSPGEISVWLLARTRTVLCRASGEKTGELELALADFPELGAICEQGGEGGWSPPRIFSSPGGEVAMAGAFSLRYQGQVVGLLTVPRMEERHRAAARLLSELFPPALMHLEMYDSLMRDISSRDAKLEAIHEMAEIFRNLDLDRLLAKILEMFLGILGGQAGALLMKEPEGWRNRIEWGLRQEVIDGLKVEGKPLGDFVLAQGEPWMMRTGEAPGWENTSGMNITSCYALPLLVTGGIPGVVLAVNVETSFSPDEVLTSISRFAAMALENARLCQEMLEKQRFTQQLKLARDIQMSFIPREFPQLPGLEVVGWSQSCDETGGDYLDFQTLPDGRLALMIGDVSGHGLGSAIFMATARAGLRALLYEHRDLGKVFRNLNYLLYNDMEGKGQFMTLAVFLIDPGRRVFSYGNAGHDAPLWGRVSGRKDSELSSLGMPLGMMEEATYRSLVDLPLEAGDRWVFFTDGIWEVKSEQGEFFGKDRLGKILVDNPGVSAKMLLQKISSASREHAGKRGWRDDATLLVVKVCL